MSLPASRRIYTLLMGVLVLAIILAACAQAQPTPTATAKPSPTSAPVQKAPAAVPTPTAPAAASPTAAAKPPAKVEKVATQAPTPAASGAPAPAAKSATVKVGHLGLVGGNAQLYIALEKGYFKEQGIEVELVPFRGGVEMVPHLATGDLHAGLSSYSAALFNALARGIALKAVASYAITSNSLKMGTNAGAITVRKDLFDAGAVKDYKDLKGKTLAINIKGSLSEWVADIVLKKGGLTFNDVNLVEIGFPDQMVALGNKRVDVAYQVEPFVVMSTDRNLSAVWKGQGDITPEVEIGALFYSPKLDPEVGKRFMVAYLKGSRDYVDGFIYKKKSQKEVESLVGILTKHTSAKDPVLYGKMEYYGIHPDGLLNVPSIVEQQDWYASAGHVKEKVDIKGLVDNQYVEYAIRQLGAYR